MNTGMLWYDNDPTTTVVLKVSRAADYYATKYGVAPNVCVVNPAMLPEGQLQAGNVAVRTSRAILPGHFWIGREETPATVRAMAAALEALPTGSGGSTPG